VEAATSTRGILSVVGARTVAQGVAASVAGASGTVTASIAAFGPPRSSFTRVREDRTHAQ